MAGSLAITDLVPGARHDTYAFKAYGLDKLLDSSALADKGYVDLGSATLVKRDPGQRLEVGSWAEEETTV